VCCFQQPGVSVRDDLVNGIWDWCGCIYSTCIVVAWASRPADAPASAQDTLRRAVMANRTREDYIHPGFLPSITFIEESVYLDGMEEDGLNLDGTYTENQRADAVLRNAAAIDNSRDAGST